jgi:hypothetical protein
MTPAAAAERRHRGVSDWGGDLVNWLRLAAAPTFAIMALLTGPGGGSVSKLCGSGSLAPLGDMTLMYALMSIFNAPPWLRLIWPRRGSVGQRL